MVKFISKYLRRSRRDVEPDSLELFNIAILLAKALFSPDRLTDTTDSLSSSSSIALFKFTIFHQFSNESIKTRC